MTAELGWAGCRDMGVVVASADIWLTSCSANYARGTVCCKQYVVNSSQRATLCGYLQLTSRKPQIVHRNENRDEDNCAGYEENINRGVQVQVLHAAVPGKY